MSDEADAALRWRVGQKSIVRTGGVSEKLKKKQHCNDSAMLLLLKRRHNVNVRNYAYPAATGAAGSFTVCDV